MFSIHSSANVRDLPLFVGGRRVTDLTTPPTNLMRYSYLQTFVTNAWCSGPVSAFLFLQIEEWLNYDDLVSSFYECHERAENCRRRTCCDCYVLIPVQGRIIECRVGCGKHCLQACSTLSRCQLLILDTCREKAVSNHGWSILVAVDLQESVLVCLHNERRGVEFSAPIGINKEDNRGYLTSFRVPGWQ